MGAYEVPYAKKQRLKRLRAAQKGKKTPKDRKTGGDFWGDVGDFFTHTHTAGNKGAAVTWLLDNVFDKEYVGSVIVNQGAGQFFEPASERQFLLGVTVGLKWK